MNTIVEEFQVGYKLNDRVLRASMVSVSEGQSNPEISEENTKEDKKNTKETEELSADKEDTTDE